MDMVVAKTEATGDEVPLSLVDFWDGILFDKIHALNNLSP